MNNDELQNQPDQAGVINPQAPLVATPPAIDKAMLQEAMAEALAQERSNHPTGEAQAYEELKRRMAGENQPSMETGEERAYAELKRRMGLDSIEQQNKELKEAISQMQALQNAERVNKAVSELKSEFGEGVEEAIVSYLNSLPEAQAQQLNNLAGWRLIAQVKLGSTPKPDPLTSSSTGASYDTLAQKANNGALSDIDRGNLLLKSAGLA